MDKENTNKKRLKPEAVGLCNKVMCLLGDKILLVIDGELSETLKNIKQAEGNNPNFMSGYLMGLAKAGNIVQKTIANTYASELLEEAITKIKELHTK